MKSVPELTCIHLPISEGWKAKLAFLAGIREQVGIPIQGGSSLGFLAASNAD